MTLKDRKILVTGGAGFIGSNLVDELLRRGNEVTAIDDLSTGSLENLKEAMQFQTFRFVQGEIQDQELIKDIMKDVEIVFHEAAIGSVPKSIENPLKTHEVNSTGTLILLDIARKHDIERFIFASSSSVYGTAEGLPKTEEMRPVPISPYGTSKLSAESYAFSFYQVYGLKTVSIRYFNVFGPRQSDSPYSGVIPIWFSRIKQNKPPIIYGDGTQSRDFTYVKDVVDQNILAAEKTAAIGEIFNSGTGSRTTISELAEIMLKLTGSSLKPIHEQPRPGDIKHSLADISKARKKLGYEPKYDLRSGLKDYHEWLSREGSKN
ncbi:MAG: SDR family oxidoreductase [Candidatus Helarchaeales archaeon]